MLISCIAITTIFSQSESFRCFNGYFTYYSSKITPVVKTYCSSNK